MRQEVPALVKGSITCAFGLEAADMSVAKTSYLVSSVHACIP